MPIKIIELHTRNVKRITAVDITPTSAVTIIAGDNGAGKSSVLDSIRYVLAGTKAIPEEPLRQGAKSGRSVLKLDGDKERGILPLTVTRTFTQKGGSLEIRSTETGEASPSPQAILDSWRARFIDPLGLMRLDPKKQVEAMRELLGLDFETMDAERQKAYDQRTIVNRDVASLQGRVRAIAKVEDAPEEEVSVAELSVELQVRRTVNENHADARRDLLAHEISHDGLREAALGLENAATELRNQLRVTEASLEKAVLKVKAYGTALEEKREAVAALQEADTAEILSRIETAEEYNRKVRSNQQRAALIKELDTAEQGSEHLTALIDEIDAGKEVAIQGAKWPVIGMGFNASGLTWEGLPFEQASSSEQLRVSVAVGFAMNPILPVLLVYGGSLLDDDSMALLAELAEEHNGQIFIERVGDGDPSAIIIEDGHVKEPVEPEADDA